MGRSEISSIFSKPITSPETLERSLPYRGTTFTTLADSSETVLATAPPQPASYDLVITRAFVPGGPEPRTNGLGNLMPLTVIERSILHSCSVRDQRRFREGKRGRTLLNPRPARRRNRVADHGRTAR